MKILFAASEAAPYIKSGGLGDVAQALPEALSREKDCEVTVFLPYYAAIKNNPAFNIEYVTDFTVPLSWRRVYCGLFRAASRRKKLTIYFIDNEDYFKRKQIDRDDDGNFFNDNGERAIFFARGVLETVKKLRWAPDVIHCQGWITQILPLYLKKMYKDDPIFANSKIVLSLYDDMPEKFDEELSRLVKYGDITDNDIPLLADPTGINLAKTAVQYSDGVIIGSEGVDNELIEYSRGLGLPVLPYDGKSIEDGTYFDAYNSFYDKLG